MVPQRRPSDAPPRPLPECAYWPAPTALPGGLVWEEPMRFWQSGLCAICGFPDRLVRDHDHSTGLIRGLLCTSCNIREGWEWGTKWVAYRQGCNPAGILGIDVPFYP